MHNALKLGGAQVWKPRGGGACGRRLARRWEKVTGPRAWGAPLRSRGSRPRSVRAGAPEQLSAGSRHGPGGGIAGAFFWGVLRF